MYQAVHQDSPRFTKDFTKASIWSTVLQEFLLTAPYELFGFDLIGFRGAILSMTIMIGLCVANDATELGQNKIVLMSGTCIKV